MNDTSTTVSVPLAEQDDTNENKFLSFCLGTEEYGVEILRVREIIGIIDITPLPQMPNYVEGVINLRGKIIPVVALRPKFGMPSVEHTEETCIIVVEVGSGEATEEFSIGVIVDTVKEVLDIPRKHIEPAPAFGSQVSTEYILGMGKIKERVVILLDINKVMTESEMSDLESVSNTADANKHELESTPTG